LAIALEKEQGEATGEIQSAMDARDNNAFASTVRVFGSVIAR